MGRDMKTIGLEEHFIIPELFGYSASTKNVAGPGAWEDASRRLVDFLELRIPKWTSTPRHAGSFADVARNPGRDASRVAVSNAIKVNDFLKTVIDEHPTRFGGFAALPLQDPKAAADELERTVKQYASAAASSTRTLRASISITPTSTSCGSVRRH